ncbi:ABC transporter permease [Roseomonas terrae]|jgi:putative spermidine/putrescine transport system permease protein|uniref:ABC transporter permease n=1 Tax=Neoroseomonas terrae TaxID=424799 RepID=A0ABS5ECN0_9PROT|nr:ABC transporter permease [Neoroseomonas terrae]MBR0648784.1 ABC transporter permease [Neoroseomonas terrae]
MNRPALLTAPLLLFLLLTFVAPIGAFLWRGVTDGEVAPVLPRTIAALAGWDGRVAPGEPAFAALVADLREARQRDASAIPRAAARLNADRPGFRGLLPMTARRAEAPFEGTARDAVLAISEEWGEAETWGAIRRAGGPLSAFHVLTALDLRQDAAGSLRAVPEDQAVFRLVLLRSLWISLMVTACCLLLGWPLAWLIATSKGWPATVLLAAVMLPFWISLIVRTAAWMVLLQREGVVNAALGGLGIGPLPLMMNRFAVVLAMVHILLPFMVLPLVAAFRALDPRLPRAAASLGAAPWRVFLRVTLPLCLPGIGAGCLLVFIQALGFYVTPALLGGPNDQMLAWFVGFYATRSVNWGLAAALSVLLLAAVGLCVALYGKLAGFRRPGAA